MRGWRLFLAQLHEVLAILLLTASTTSTALSFYERKVVLACLAIATLVVVLLNAALGYVQEARVEAAWAACFDQSLRYAPTQRGERHSPRRKLVLILPKRDRFQRTDAPFNRSARDDSGD